MCGEIVTGQSATSMAHSRVSFNVHMSGLCLTWCCVMLVCACLQIYEEEFARVKGHFGPINALAIHPNGASYCSGTSVYVLSICMNP